MSRKIRNIVILVYRLTGGGAERVATLWANGFILRGYNVTILTELPQSDRDYKLHPSIKVRQIGYNVRCFLLRGLLSKLGVLKLLYKRRLYEELHSIRPDVCIGVLGTYALDAYRATRDIGSFIIQTEHNAYESTFGYEMSHDQIKMKFETNRIFDCVTVLTEADTKVPNVPTSNMVVLPNPLSFEPVQKVPCKDKIILAAGRLDAWRNKGFDILINAWGKIAKQYPDWKLQIAGTGSKQSIEYLQRLATSYRLCSQIEFVGFDTDIIQLYQRASIFVLSSRGEGFGMVLTEAMSQGCACIACDYKGRQREIIPSDKEGLICQINNEVALKEAMERMLSDEVYREGCRLPAIERSKYYSIDNTIDRWEKTFHQLNTKSKDEQAN